MAILFLISDVFAGCHNGDVVKEAVKSRVKTYVKKVDAAVAAGDKAAAEAALPVAIGEISKAASKGIYHKNTAARKVSRITKAVNAMA